MGDPKMTARERLRPHSIRHEEDELGVVSRVVLLDVAIQIAEEHAAAAVKDLEARVAELEGILHDAPTIDAVESHVPGWLARVRAALGKEAQT